MTICLKCHRPLKHPTESGLGPVCAKNAQPTPEVKPDLFGYDIEAAAMAAKERIAEFIASAVSVDLHITRIQFRELRERLLPPLGPCVNGPNQPKE